MHCRNERRYKFFLISDAVQLTHMIKDHGDGRYSGFCEELGLATCGKSLDETKRRLAKATAMVLSAATERGELLELLKEKGVAIDFEVKMGT